MTLRLAVVGVGDVAQRDYLPELARLGDRVELAVVAARTEERARGVAERFGAGRWTTSYEDAVAADDVDAVVNLTPFSLHVEVTLASLRAGKHVYSEKPLAPSTAEVDAIAAAARDRGLVVVAAPSVLLFPQVRRALELVRSGELGPVRTARAHALGGIPPWEGYLSDPTPFFSSLGGPLVDMAVYPLHALTGLLGPVRRVAALAARTRDAFTIGDGPFSGREVRVEVDDSWELVVELEGGCLASVEANNAVDEALAPELELRGERGVLGLSLLDVAQPLQLLAGGERRDEPVEHARPGGGPDHVLGIEHLADCVAHGMQPVAGIEHARHVIEVIEAARRSSADHVAVAVSSSFPRPGAAEPEVGPYGG
jgi:predicted dehydrogenase